MNLCQVVNGFAVFCCFMFILGVMLGTAYPHEARDLEGNPTGWHYHADCCSDQDCEAIPDSAIVEMAEGYRITLKYTQHKTLRTLGPNKDRDDGLWVFNVPGGNNDLIRQSGDRHVHVCIIPPFPGEFPGDGPDEEPKPYVRCVYIKVWG